MSQKRNSQKQITRAYHSRIRGMLKGQVEKEIFDALSAGKNTYLRYDRLQSSSFDSSWIEMIEGVIFDLGEIIANPRMNTKVEGNIVPVELARKTGAESVQHLSSHTQYIKEIDEYGNVIPSKIMTMVNEDDLHTYENRFIATLVRRLVLFIEKRYEVVSEFAELKNQEVLMFKNKSIINGAEVEIETKVRVAYKSDDTEALKSNAYIERIKQIRTYILYFYNSSFMRQLKTERDVRNPILQTNIIRKNPKYHHCYEVYRFIETYDKLGVNYKVDENYSIFSDEEREELNHTLFANYVTLRGKDISKNHKEIKHIYKPRILTSIDDEQFIYGDHLKGPISFVRTDEKYQEYLNSKIRKDLPLHPTKHEKEYYADEYEEKRANREDLKQKEDLLKRKNKDLRQFEKSVEKILEEREQARLHWEQLEKEIIANEENARLTEARNALIAASLANHQEVEKDYEASEEEQKLEELRKQIAETQVTPMSHPESEPVTYDEAVEQIWPQINGVPAPAEEPVSEQPVEEAPVLATPSEPVMEETPQEQPVEESIKPAVVPVAMSHPVSEPVTYDQAVEQIWPQINNQLAPVRKKEQVVATPVKESKVEATPSEDIKPAVIPVPMSHPASEPVTYEQAVEQIWPQVNKPVPAVKREEVAPQPVVIEEPVEEAIKPAVIPTPMSHPASKAVTYDEAVEEIWPNINNAPAPRKAEPIPQPVTIEAPEEVEEPVDEEIKPAVVPVEMSHPESEPVTYEQAVEQIWPQVLNQPVKAEPQQEAKKAPRKKAAKPVEQPVAKPAPKAKKTVKPAKQETFDDIKPAVVPVEMSHPASEPVTYEQAVEQIWPNINNVPALKKEEKAPVKKNAAKKPTAKKPAAKKKEAAKPEEKPAKKAAPKAKKAKPVETPAPQPVVEEQPVIEEPAPAPVEEVPAPAPEKPIEEPVKEEKPKAKKPQAKKPVPVVVKAPKAKKAQVKKAKPKPAPKKPEPREKIPGKFIVKTNKGYYISKNKYSIYKDEAKIFDDFNLANDIKKQQGGKVVKL